MARKIKFPLKMKNGAEVRTLEELKVNFDLDSVLGYFTDGKLQTWLADHYYDDKADAIALLQPSMSNLNEKICEILEVAYTPEENATSLEVIQHRNEKLRILKLATADEEIINNVDKVAFSQEELLGILASEPSYVYLYGDTFHVPIEFNNVQYIGVNEPLVILNEGKYLFEYEHSRIHFKHIRIQQAECITCMSEKYFLEGNYEDALSFAKKEADDGIPRAKYIMARFYNDGYQLVPIDKEKRDAYVKDALSFNDPLLKFGYGQWILSDNKEKQQLFSRIFSEMLTLSKQGNALAQSRFGFMFDMGYGVLQDYSKAVEWYQNAASQGLALGLTNLGVMYENGNGVSKDYARAVECYRIAAEKGYAGAQVNLGNMYRYGNGVIQDGETAISWYQKAAKQGLVNAYIYISECYSIGSGIQANGSEALRYLRIAQEKGATIRDYSWGCAYEADKQLDKAVSYYERSGDLGLMSIQLLANMLSIGFPSTEDLKRALSYYQRAKAMTSNKDTLENIDSCIKDIQQRLSDNSIGGFFKSLFG